MLAENSKNYTPKSFYGVSKACSELLAKNYFDQLNVSIARIFHPYGPNGDNFLINRLFNNVLNNQKIIIEGIEGISLNPIYIDELSDALVNLLFINRKGIFHFGGPKVYTLKEIIEIFANFLNKPINIKMIPKDFVKCQVGEFKRTTQVLNFNPKIDINTAIELYFKKKLI
mgnify:CR=1 FL=1